MGSLTSFEWTSDESTDYRRAVGDSMKTDRTPSPTKNAVETVGALDGNGKGGTAGGGPDGRRLSKSLRNALFDKFGRSARVSPQGALGTTTGTGGGRRSTHVGLIDVGDPTLRPNMVHYRPQEFMDPDTAAQVLCGRR